MLDLYFQRTDIRTLLQSIISSKRYYQKKLGSFENYLFTKEKEIALFIFYDALIKYYIIIEDEKYLKEFIEQTEKLYRNLNSFEEIRIGIHKLLIKIVSNIKNIIDIEEEKESIISYIYEKYIVNGFVVHGFNSRYLEDILNNGFIPEEYHNYYERFIKLKDIINKYKIDIELTKDFLEKNIYLTDDFVMGCYYSLYGPMFYNSIIKDLLPIKDVKDLEVKLKKQLNKYIIAKKDLDAIIDLLKEEWQLLHEKEQVISLLLIKRKDIFLDANKLNDYLKRDESCTEIVDSILSSKYGNIEFNRKILKKECKIITFETYQEKNIKNKIDEDLEIDKKVFYLLILATVMINLGVIITLIMLFVGVI